MRGNIIPMVNSENVNRVIAAIKEEIYGVFYNNADSRSYHARIRSAGIYIRKGKTYQARKHFGFCSHTYVCMQSLPYRLLGQCCTRLHKRAYNPDRRLFLYIYGGAGGNAGTCLPYPTQKIRRRKIPHLQRRDKFRQLRVHGRTAFAGALPRQSQRDDTFRVISSRYEHLRLDDSIRNDNTGQKIYQTVESHRKPCSDRDDNLPAALLHDLETAEKLQTSSLCSAKCLHLCAC